MTYNVSCISKMKNKFNFEFNFTETKDDVLTEGTWHIYESDLCGDHSIVKKAIEGEFCDDDIEVKLYKENGKQINGDESHGLFVAYQGGVPVTLP